MVTTLAIYLVSIPADVMIFIAGLFNSVTPTWMTTGINNIFQGSGFLQSILPIYPHPGMNGLAGQTGIMPMFGWFLVILGYLVIIRIGIWAVNMFISVLPWNTHAVKQPHRMN